MGRRILQERLNMVQVHGFDGREGCGLGAQARRAEMHGDESGRNRHRRLFAREIALRPDQHHDP